VHSVAKQSSLFLSRVAKKVSVLIITVDYGNTVHLRNNRQSGSCSKAGSRFRSTHLEVVMPTEFEVVQCARQGCRARLPKTKALYHQKYGKYFCTFYCVGQYKDDNEKPPSQRPFIPKVMEGGG
jgi:hypothetical protein